MPLRTVLAAAGLYFGLVFAVGFVLGSIRVPLIVPLIGVRWAELAEMPLMFVAVYLAAGHVVQRFRRLHGTGTAGAWCAVGLVALGMLVLAELLLAVALAGRSVADYLASRDPVSGAVYLVMLAVFAAMPWWRCVRAQAAVARAGAVSSPGTLAGQGAARDVEARRAMHVVRLTGGVAVVLFTSIAWYLSPLKPGVLALQLAFTPRAFGTIVHLWPAEHLARFRNHLPFDCLLLAAYGAFGYFLSTRTGIVAGLSPVLRSGAVRALPTAAVCDLVENGLHWWLTEVPRFGVPAVYAIAATAATLKWALVLGFGILCLCGALSEGRSGPGAPAEPDR